MATDAEIIDVLIRLRGGAAAAADARAVAGAFQQITGAQRGVSQSSGEVEQQTRRTGNLLSGTIGIAVRYAAAYKGLGLAMAAIGSGFRFDATMQNNTIAFTHFLGSTQAARQELGTLYQIAAKTPFQFADVTSATRRFLAFGFSVEQANSELRLIGDAIAGMGGGQEEINRLVLVLGQINAAGKLQGQDLLQLEQLGVVSRVQIAQQLGMSVATFNDEMRKSKITSTEAIDAINNVIRTQFAGSAEEQSKTVTGQLSTIKDYGSQAMGALVAPLFGLAQSSVLPFITGHLQSAAHWLSDPKQGGAGGAQRIADTLVIMAKVLGPVVGLLAAYKVAMLGVAAAQGLAAFSMGAYTTAVTFFTAVSLIPEITSLADAWYLLDAAMDANPVGVLVIAFGALTTAAVLALTHIQEIEAAIDSLNRKLAHFQQKHPVLGAGVKGAIGGLYNVVPGGLQAAQALHLPGAATGGYVQRGGTLMVGEKSAELVHLPTGSWVEPQQPGGGFRSQPDDASASRVLQPLYLMVNDRVFAEAMLDVGRTAQARGG
jgi:tape measure domain-containing protein